MITQCDKEPIHLLSKIRDDGYLLVIDTNNYHLIQTSENLSCLLKKDIDRLLNLPLLALFGSEYFQQLKKIITTKTENSSKIGKFFSQYEEKEICTFVHQYHNYAILEIIFSKDTKELVFQNINQIQNIIKQCRLYDNFEQIYQKIIEQIQKISGFDRVMLYKFDENYNGQIVAQVTKTMHENFLGHHFPASDIPVQARALYLINRFRTISNNTPIESNIVPTINPLTKTPLDLTNCFLRGVSPIHLEYLKNMGVTASMSLSLIVDGKLWGMVVAHHPNPKTIPLLQYEFYISLSYIFSQQIEQKILIQTYDKKLELEFQRKLFFNALKTHPEKNFLKSLYSLRKELLNIVNADEVVVITKEKIFSANGYLEENEVVELISHTSALLENDSFISHTLLQQFPQFKKFKQKFAGISLDQFEFDGEKIFIAFLRFEQTYVIKWAGEPNKKVEYKDGNIVLSPRASFESWKEEVSGTAIPFDTNELDSLALFFEKLPLVAFEMKKQQETAKLKELNKKLTIQANTDPLTLLYNQRYFKELGAIQFKKSQETLEHFSLVLIDLYDFKYIKENYGNEMSDYLLLWVTSKIKQILPEKGTVVSRIGCEEFALLHCCKTELESEKFLQKILQQLTQSPINIGETNFNLTIHYGMVDFDKQLYRNFSEMVRATELQLYLFQNANK